MRGRDALTLLIDFVDFFIFEGHSNYLLACQHSPSEVDSPRIAVVGGVLICLLLLFVLCTGVEVYSYQALQSTVWVRTRPHGEQFDIRLKSGYVTEKQMLIWSMRKSVIIGSIYGNVDLLFPGLEIIWNDLRNLDFESNIRPH